MFSNLTFWQRAVVVVVGVISVCLGVAIPHAAALIFSAIGGFLIGGLV
jgi:hypothetical protein